MRATSCLLILVVVIALVGCDSNDSSEPRLELVEVDRFAIPLDALAGTYEYADPPQDTPPRSREFTFRIPAEVQDFRELRLVASGSLTPGLVERTYDLGGGNTITDTFSICFSLDLQLSTNEDPDRCLVALVPAREGEFSQEDAVSECGSSLPADLTDLLGVEVHATLICDMQLGGNDRLVAPAHGVVTEVRLDAIDASVLQESDGMGWPYTIRPVP